MLRARFVGSLLALVLAALTSAAQAQPRPGGTLVIPQTASYFLPDFRTKALLSIDAQLKDDHDNVINQSVLVKVE